MTNQANQKIQEKAQIKNKITKTSYEKIIKSVDSWPQWKKNLCNQELIISVKSKKI